MNILLLKIKVSNDFGQKAEYCFMKSHATNLEINQATKQLATQFKANENLTVVIGY